MRTMGTKAYGIRLPIISRGDDLARIVADSVIESTTSEKINLSDSDVIGITEAITAKSQNNFATLDDIAEDVRSKFPGGEIGLVFPILSRNRFLDILKGISKGVNKLHLLLQYPTDEVGNPLIDLNDFDELENKLPPAPVPAKAFREAAPVFKHPFTGIDYISLYEKAGDNIEIYISNDPRDILKLTKNVLVCEIHNRFRTKNRLLKAGAETVYTLSDILSAPIKRSSGDSGYNPEFGVLGSNISTGEDLKLFPRDCESLVNNVRDLLYQKTGVRPEVLIYGDGAFKDPYCGIWELADPVVSPFYSERLGGRPNEIKLKYVAENNFAGLSPEDKKNAIIGMIKSKEDLDNGYAVGTTPRIYADLLGTLCDLMGGSGDKGTPVILIQGYFDDYSVE